MPILESVKKIANTHFLGPHSQTIGAAICTALGLALIWLQPLGQLVSWLAGIAMIFLGNAFL